MYEHSDLKIVAIAGGVGGARLADGLAQVLPPKNLTVIVNTGDDFEHLGLKICPDLDTVCYTLAGLANHETGWGRWGETWHALDTLGELGGETWFRLGDRDLGLHLERTRRLAQGESLTQITRHICMMLGVQANILPATDTPVPTQVHTTEGMLGFQEYFVRRRCKPVVMGFEFAGIEQATPASGVIEAIQDADLVVICPSNPWVSVGPVLAISGIQRALAGKFVLAVSPIIAGQTIKGPAAKMYRELGIEPSALAVARHYEGVLRGFVFDILDQDLRSQVEGLGLHSLVTDTVMRTDEDRRRLAEEILVWADRCRRL
jgi:LPPG:FO 2-phospho-L-lactate transferase